MVFVIQEFCSGRDVGIDLPKMIRQSCRNPLIGVVNDILNFVNDLLMFFYRAPFVVILDL